MTAWMRVLDTFKMYLICLAIVVVVLAAMGASELGLKVLFCLLMLSASRLIIIEHKTGKKDSLENRFIHQASIAGLAWHNHLTAESIGWTLLFSLTCVLCTLWIYKMLEEKDPPDSGTIVIDMDLIPSAFVALLGAMAMRGAIWATTCHPLAQVVAIGVIAVAVVFVTAIAIWAALISAKKRYDERVIRDAAERDRRTREPYQL